MSLRPDKRLGQHFLRDADVLREIVEVADVGRSAGVLEIGPGDGALTSFLVKTGKPVHALDLDPRAVAEVAARFGDEVRVAQGDAVTADLAGMLPPVGADGRLPVVVGNLPYNAGTAIYRRLLELGGQVSRLVLMFQREVAIRVVSPEGSRAYGLLSVLTALQARAWLVREVPPQAFRPPPKVHSGLVLVEPMATPLVTPEEREPLTRFVGHLFQARRKTLANAFDRPDLLEAEGIAASRRPEELDPLTMLRLFRATRDEA